MYWTWSVSVALLLARASEGSEPGGGRVVSNQEPLVAPSSVSYTSVLEGLLLDKITVLEHQVGALKGLQLLDYACEYELAGSPNRTYAKIPKLGKTPEVVGRNSRPVLMDREFHEAYDMVKEAQMLQEATKSALAAARKREEKLQMERDALRAQLEKLQPAEDEQTRMKETRGQKSTQASKVGKQLKMELEALKSEKDALLQSSRDLQAQLLEEIQARQMLRKTSEEAEMQSATLCKSLKIVEADVASYEKRLKDAEEARVLFQSDAEMYSLKLQAVSQELETATAQARTLATDVEKGVGKRRLEEKLEDAVYRAEEATQEKEALLAKLEAWVKAIGTPEEAPEQFTKPLSREEMLKQLRDMEDRAEVKVRLITLRVDKAERTAAEATAILATLGQDKTKLTQELESSRKQIDVLTITNTVTERRASKAEERVRTLTQNVEGESKVRREAEAQRDLLAKRVEVLNDRVERLEGEKVHWQSEVTERDDEVRRAASHCGAVSRERGALKERVGELEGLQAEQAERQAQAWRLVAELKQELAAEQKTREAEGKGRWEGREGERVLQAKVDDAQRRLHESQAEVQRVKQTMRLLAAEKEEAVLLHNMLQLRLDKCGEGGQAAGASADVRPKGVLARAAAALGLNKVEREHS